jgi:hypothetical protein
MVEPSAEHAIDEAVAAALQHAKRDPGRDAQGFGFLFDLGAPVAGTGEPVGALRVVDRVPGPQVVVPLHVVASDTDGDLAVKKAAHIGLQLKPLPFVCRAGAYSVGPGGTGIRHRPPTRCSQTQTPHQSRIEPRKAVGKLCAARKARQIERLRTDLTFDAQGRHQPDQCPVGPVLAGRALIARPVVLVEERHDQRPAGFPSAREEMRNHFLRAAGDAMHGNHSGHRLSLVGVHDPGIRDQAGHAGTIE